MIEFFGVDAYSLPIYSSSRPETACITFKHTRKNHIIWIEYFKCDYSLKITFDDSSEAHDLVSLVKNYLDENAVLNVVTIHPNTEEMLGKNIQKSSSGSIPLIQGNNVTKLFA